jgi:gliding motility-associated-like protein
LDKVGSIRKFLLLLFICVGSENISSQVLQNTNMQTNTITLCRSKFYDDGGPTTAYLSVLNTVVTKTLTIIGGGPITMTFNPGLTQTQIQAGDFITFYDGMNAAAPLIGGPFTAINPGNPLNTIFAPSGTLTVVWSENGNTVGHGWNGGWFSLAPPPLPPTPTLAPIPLCNSQTITVITDHGILCDSLKKNFFNITGPIFPVINTVTAIGPCNNGTTTAFQIVLNAPYLNENCTYQVTSTLFRKDKCDSIYKYQGLLNTFSISSCPITGSINVASTNTVCAYSCTANVRAVVPASVCLTLNYTWDNGLPSSVGPHPVCPTITTVYNCTVSVASAPSNSVVLTRTVFLIDPQFGPIASTSVCQNSGSFLLPATPPGGNWFGPGTNSLTGSFSTFQTPGIKTVTYQVGSCFTSTQITIIAGSAGSDDAACLNGPSFTVTGGTPLGGTWSGPHISPTGVFTPTQVGSFIVTYSVGSCSDTKVVTVTNAITVPTVAIDICKSQWYTYLYQPQYSVTPFGGRYSCTTPGAIINSVLGTFSATAAGPGTHVITYSLASGCSATFAVNVLDIDVSPQTATTCPSKAPFLISTVPSTAIPAGGTWSCVTPGTIQNPVTGLYDPSVFSLNTHTDILVYKAPNGCPDTIRMQAIRTNLITDSLFFCTTNPAYQLSNSFATFSYVPAGGIYSGPGVSFSAGNYFFTPSVAGPGIHTVKYTISGCDPDSVKMLVYPNMVTGFNATLCSTHPTVMLVSPPMPFGTRWIGPGIITASTGIFDPSAVTPGSTVVLTYTNRGGCSNTVSVYVYQFVAANISGLGSVYCFQNTNVPFTTAPPNGSLTTVSTITNNTFNPSVVGAGQYTLSYQYGTGACLTSTSVVVKVHPQLTTTTSVSAPTICLGQSSILNVKGSGGLPSVTQYSYTWTNNLTPQNTHNVIPNSTTIYTCITSDGCSDPVIDTFRVFVYPTYYPAFVTPHKQCYGVAAQVTTNITPSTGPFTYTWSTTPVQTSNVLNGVAGKNYFLKIKNTATGCTKDTSVVIPGYNAIKALFSPNPNLNCVPFEESTISFLDLSNGATGGSWSFNGTTLPYAPGQTVSHDFVNPGNYNVTLNVVNEGNCPSSYALSVCVLESTDIFLPDIFSPNNDGANDVLFLRGNGVKEMVFQIYDRWGNKVFESTDVKTGWDGTYKGKDAEPGVYAYYLNVTMFTEKKLVQKGDITLVR